MSTRKNALYKIENKIFEQKELQDFAALIWKEYQPRHIGAREKKFNVYVKCYDDVSYQDDTTKIFNSDSEIYKERIQSIEILAQCDNSLYIKLRINHGQLKVEENFYTTSDLEIGGDNFEKIHDIQARFLRQIKSIKEQHNILIEKDKYLLPAVFVLCMFTFGFIIDFFITRTPTPYWRNALNDWTNFIGYTLLAVMAGWAGATAYRTLVHKSVDYWPMVEIRIGPEHLRPEVRQREYIMKFAGLVILPLALAVIYDLFKLIVYLAR